MTIIPVMSASSLVRAAVSSSDKSRFMVRIWGLDRSSRTGLASCFEMRDKAGCRSFGVREHVANDEHLALLRQGSAIWNEWRKRNPGGPKPDLTDANLSFANLSYADLTDADLIDADLSFASLSYADLTDADLIDANLSYANLSYADLTDANLSEAKLSHANLTGANLFQANVNGAILTEADLTDTNLIAAFLPGTNFTEATLSEAKFNRAEFFGTILGNVDLSRAVGLAECVHYGPSTIDFATLARSQNLPISFLRGCGLPDNFIDYLQSLREEALQFYSCFISYSTKDQVFADRLHADLQNQGVRCWFAPHDLPIGAKTWDAIDEAIRLRDKLLLILSKASIASEWVEDEVNKAYAEERSRNQTVLFPIRVDNAVMSTAEPWAVKLRDQRNIGDFRQWRKPAEYQKSLDRLLRDLKASATR
jgi:uncharacterized protein YjbI with pentapeptide repeats